MADEQLETTEPMLLNPAFLDTFRSWKCTCEHQNNLHDRYLGCKWESGEQECSCETFVRAHVGRRPSCWCYGTPLEIEHPDEVFVSTTAVQRALDIVRDDLVLLKLQLEGWGDTEDLNERVTNWHHNTWRHMEDILQES